MMTKRFETPMTTLRIGAVIADISSNQLRTDSEDVRLEPKVMDLLAEFSKRPAETLNRADLIGRIWGVEHGGDESLTRAVSLLRKAFAQLDPGTTYLVTVPKRGYRLVAAVLHEPSQGIGEAEPIKAHTPPKRIWRKVVAALVVAFAVAIFIYDVNVSTPPSIIAAEGTIEVATPSLAVLPFKIIGDASGQAYLADGVSEEILSRLTQVEDLRVVGRSSSFAVGRDGDDHRDIGAQLGVSHILEGAIQRDGDRLRLTAKLISTDDGALIWSKRYDREITQIFTVQDEIAGAVVEALHRRLFDLPAHDALRNLNSYDLYLKGLYAWRRREVSGGAGAISLLERALRMDPNMTDARAVLAVSYNLEALHANFNGLAGDTLKYQQLALETAETTLISDPENAVALATIGAVRMQQFRWVEAQRLMEEALALDPHDEIPSVFLSTLFATVGNSEKALTVLDDALQVNPTSPSLHRSLAVRAFNTMDYERTITHANIAYENGAISASNYTPAALAALGRIDEAIDLYHSLNQEAHLAISARPDGKPDPILLFLNGFYGDGQRAEFFAWVEANPNYFWTTPARMLDNATLADALTIDAITAKYFYRAPVQLEELWAPLSSDFRKTHAFKELVASMNLPAYWREYGWPQYCNPRGEDDFACE